MKPLFVAWAPLTLVVLLGCGPGRGDLSGEVTFRGKKLLTGSVVALPSDRVPRTVVIEEGRYTFPELPGGPVKLAVHCPNPAKAKVIPRKKEDVATKADARGWFAIPDRYASPDDSGLQTEVRAGSNKFDLQLQP